MDDTISVQAAIDALNLADDRGQIHSILDVIDIIKALPSAQQWIPCSERLPELAGYYLVTRRCFGWHCTEYRETDIAIYDFNGWHKVGTASEVGTVIAWCELPEPYKEDSDNE